jgi:hypothetical protein
MKKHRDGECQRSALYSPRLDKEPFGPSQLPLETEGSDKMGYGIDGGLTARYCSSKPETGKQNM